MKKKRKSHKYQNLIISIVFWFCYDSLVIFFSFVWNVPRFSCGQEKPEIVYDSFASRWPELLSCANRFACSPPSSDRIANKRHWAIKIFGVIKLKLMKVNISAHTFKLILNYSISDEITNSHRKICQNIELSDIHLGLLFFGYVCVGRARARGDRS